MVDYNRKTVSIPGENIDLEYMTLGELKNKVNFLIEKYSETKMISKVENDYDNGYYFCLMFDRPETDKEMKIRIKKEEEYEKWREDRDKQEFKRLKKKFDV
jgi:hypothetical protein